MILRRVIDHVKSQNWTAVALDFLIVVIGVFIGIQVANWDEARFTSREAEAARASLIADLQNDRDVYAVRRKFYGEVRDAAIRVNAAFEAPIPQSADAQWRFIRDVESTGVSWPFRPSAQVYNELLSSGQLDLVSNEAVLRQMRDYYQDAAQEASMMYRAESDYIIHSRKLIGWPLIKHRSDFCNIIVGANPSDVLDDGRRYLPPCETPPFTAEIAATAQRLHGAETLRGDLRYTLRQIETKLSFVEYLDDEAESLILELEKIQ